MRRACSAGLAVAVLLLATTGHVARAQEPGRALAAPPPREQVHPELVDSTWGTQTSAAWKFAFAHQWADARSRFEALRSSHPFAVEPLLGLGFVARATGDRDDTRRWYRAAFDVEPTADVQKQLDAAEWDRSGSVDLSAGATHAGSQTTADWSLGVVVPLDPHFSLTGRAGVLGGGDPLRGVFIDSASNAAQARVLSIGGVARVTDALTLGTHVEYWTSGGQNQTYLWIDGAQRLGDHLSVHAGTRPVVGSGAAPQLSGGADIILVPGEAASIDVSQATRAAQFEARTQIRVSYLAMPTLQQMFRVGILRDAGPINEATTGFVAATWFLGPKLGIHIDASARRGAFARSSGAGGIVLRW